MTCDETDIPESKCNTMRRRSFFQLSATACITMGFAHYSGSLNLLQSLEGPSDYEDLIADLLLVWTNALAATQINKPDSPELHGALFCVACNKIHGRCMDAVYPFMFMADKTGEQRYLNAAISVMNWSKKNVSRPDGSWTVIPNPKSWRGITVFGAIALGEALHHHGHLLPKEIKMQWIGRLQEAADFIYQNFTFSYSHVNYAFTAVYALNFLGRLLDNPDYMARSRELAEEVPNWLTEPNKLIFGEDQPIDKRSGKGLLPVDLGYNVEESLNGLVQYAFLEKDEKLLEVLSESMQSHLQFMLPDGAWDNSWGTRQNKWSYWGSRTTDGCQPAFALMSTRKSVFGTAAYLNTELLRKCTVNGFLAGGLHYDSHQVMPCIHHTFTHAKSLAFLLDNTAAIPEIRKSISLPRSTAEGVRHFPEIDVWLASKGPWKATVSSYDNEFKTKYSQQATGGSLALLWHDMIGPVFTASMAEYTLVEKNNQQPQPDDEDIPLTPRIEGVYDNGVFTNLFDLKATVDARDEKSVIGFNVNTQLTNREYDILPDAEYQLQYLIDIDKIIIKASKANSSLVDKNIALVLPIISRTGEKITWISDHQIQIQKEECKIWIESNAPMIIKETKRDRIFNMVPGFEAVPLVAGFSGEMRELQCIIKVGKS